MTHASKSSQTEATEFILYHFLRMERILFLDHDAVKSNGKLIASGSEDGVSRVRDVVNGELLGESKIETDRVSGADGSQEGGLFVYESGNGNGDERKNLNCVAFSPCGKIIASGNSRLLVSTPSRSPLTVVTSYQDQVTIQS